MTKRPAPPTDYTQCADLYFLEHRAKVIDIAAFLDRLDRCSDAQAVDDHRVAALRSSIEILLSEEPDRARRVLEILSDHTTDLAPHAVGQKGATGAPLHNDDGAQS